MRSNWLNRAQLCIAKLAGRLTPDAEPTAFPGLLIQTGATSSQDDFVEVQIFGPMTLYTFSKVILTGSHGRRNAQLQALEEHLTQASIPFEYES